MGASTAQSTGMLLILLFSLHPLGTAIASIPSGTPMSVSIATGVHTHSEFLQGSMAAVSELRGELCEVREPGGLWAPGLSLPLRSCATSDFPSNLPHNQGARLLCAEAGKKEAFVSGVNRPPKCRPLTNIQGHGKFTSGG